MIHKRGLGRGLSALIPSKQTVQQNEEITRVSMAVRAEEKRGIPIVSPSSSLMTISCDDIIANPYQPRSSFDAQSLENLSASIKKHGVLSPLVVSQGADGSYELISGERRLRAARMAGLTHVPVILRIAKDNEKLELALIENIQRENLNPVELAVAYRRMMDEFDLTQEDLAKRLQTSRSHIANTVRFLDLPQEIQESLAKGEINEGHAKIILSLSSHQEQVNLWKKITLHSLTVRQVEGEARRIKVKDHTRILHAAPSDIVHFQHELEERLGTKVMVQGTKTRGKIIVEYFSEEELKKIAEGWRNS